MYLLGHDLIHDGGLARVVEAHDQDLARLRAHAQRAEEALEEAHCGQHATPRMTRIPTTAAGRPRAARQSPRAPELHYYSRDTRSESVIDMDRLAARQFAPDFVSWPILTRSDRKWPGLSG